MTTRSSTPTCTPCRRACGGWHAFPAALAVRGRWQRTVERLREALEYAERPDRFRYGSDWPLAPMTAYRAFLAPLLDDPAWRPIQAGNARALFGGWDGGILQIMRRSGRWRSENRWACHN